MLIWFKTDNRSSILTRVLRDEYINQLDIANVSINCSCDSIQNEFYINGSARHTVATANVTLIELYDDKIQIAPARFEFSYRYNHEGRLINSELDLCIEHNAWADEAYTQYASLGRFTFKKKHQALTMSTLAFKLSKLVKEYMTTFNQNTQSLNISETQTIEVSAAVHTHSQPVIDMSVDMMRRILGYDSLS